MVLCTFRIEIGAHQHETMNLSNPLTKEMTIRQTKWISISFQYRYQFLEFFFHLKLLCIYHHLEFEMRTPWEKTRVPNTPDRTTHIDCRFKMHYLF